ncbi:hypothetical protein CTEN210_00359 [Chaetoceros tenuissimus]|uniref:MYND-type domain-containing protein n=1 Tax=Chaetoceros tenuissimus TaxID=426638 RepID=A0AAD3CDP3_9STRA|nr:hypothetical protein CTEN210_00359 [Chaetoceros tenuissimus]
MKESTSSSTSATHSDDLPDNVFEEFFKWSFTIKFNSDHLTDRKFSKKAPTAALMLREGKVMIDTLERFDLKFSSPTSFLLNSLSSHFKSEGERLDFGQKLQAAFRKKKLKDESKESIEIYQKIFDEHAEKWSKRREISIQECRFYQKPAKEFNRQFTSDSKLLRKHQELESEMNLADISTDDFLRTFLVTALEPSSVRVRYQCWHCETNYEGEQRKLKTVCQGCECAQYCSRECQKENWKKGHQEKCKDIAGIWSIYHSNKKRVEKARRDGRILSESVLIRFTEMLLLFHVGGEHPIFGDETASPDDLLQHTESMPFELLPNEIKAMRMIAIALAVDNSRWDKESLQRLRMKTKDVYGYEEFSLNRFLVIYSRLQETSVVKGKPWDYFVIHDLKFHNTRYVETGRQPTHRFSDEILKGTGLVWQKLSDTEARDKMLIKIFLNFFKLYLKIFQKQMLYY